MSRHSYAKYTFAFWPQVVLLKELGHFVCLERGVKLHVKLSFLASSASCPLNNS